MEPRYFNLRGGSVEVSGDRLSIADGAAKRKQAFIYLCIAGLALGALFGWEGYTKGNAFLLGSGIIILAGFVALVLLNLRQFSKIENEILFRDILNVTFKPDRRYKNFTATILTRPNKKRQIIIENTDNQVEDLKTIFRSNRVSVLYNTEPN